MELQRLWNISVEIVPIVVGALGAISSNLQKYLQKLNITDIRTSQIQKTVLLKIANILWRHLGVELDEPDFKKLTQTCHLQ